MSDQTPEIELFMAWTFDCDGCGRENFLRATPAAREDVLQSIAEFLEVEGDTLDPGVVYELPECCEKPATVTCQFCEAVFSVVPDDDAPLEI